MFAQNRIDQGIYSKQLIEEVKKYNDLHPTQPVNPADFLASPVINIIAVNPADLLPRNAV